MNWYLIPLTAEPQTFQVTLNEINYAFTFYWNPFLNDGEGNWLFDLENADTSTSLLSGAPLITGADLLSGLSYLGIAGSLVVYTQGMPEKTPSLTNLGDTSNLFFLTAGTAG